MGLFTPQTQFIRLNEWQQRAINAIMFGDNYMLIAQEQDGNAFLDLNATEELMRDGLRVMCEQNPQMLDFMTDLVIDLHNKKK